MSTTIRYENCVSELIKRIPEYTQADYEYYTEFPYDVFGCFALFLQEMMDTKEIHQDTLKKAFAFLNEMADSGDPMIESLLTVGVLEVLSDKPEHIGIAMLYLNDKGRVCFQEAIDFWDGKLRADNENPVD